MTDSIAAKFAAAQQPGRTGNWSSELRHGDPGAVADANAQSDPLGYAGRNCVVTGCRSGIGHATARLLIDVGARVHGLDWQECGLPLAAFTHVDLRDQSSIDRAATQLDGPVAALFNCAGLAPMHPWLDVMKVNFIGMRHLTQAVLENMPPGSAIVSTGSNGGAGWRQNLPDLRDFIATDTFEAAASWCEEHPLPQANPYGFSKEAIAVWTMHNSASTIARGVRLNCTSPGSVQTPMLEEIEQVVPSDRIDIVSQPIGRRSEPVEQAWALLMLNSPRATYINGVDLPVDGGFIATRLIAPAQPQRLGD